MNLLGIETSTAATAACVLRSDGRAFESLPAASALLEPPDHSRELLPAVVAQLDAADLAFADLDGIAVAIGPGGYTGLRIGIATARSLAQAQGLALRPVGTLAALAAGVDAPAVLALVDARRKQVFAALHVDGEQQWEPFAATPEAVVDRLEQAGLAGREATVAVGDGSLRFRGPLEAAAIRVAPGGSRLHVVRALHVCRLAAQAPAMAPEAVVPHYLRAPDATPLPS